MNSRFVLGPLMAFIAVVSGCGPAENSCADGEDLCDGVCLGTVADNNNCGGCGIACDGQAGEVCADRICVPLADRQCETGDTEPCYTGPAQTEGVGTCLGGLRTCGASGFFGGCEGMVAPVTEVCSNGLDEDCNGVADDDIDGDGDGFTPCGGDCCNGPGQGCSDPALVNPGAFDAIGNNVDDDCDGVADNTIPTCDGTLASNSSNPMDYAAAMDLCQTATDANDRWGVISAELVLANGVGSPDSNARSIRAGFGSGLPARAGASLAILSTGNAAAVGDSQPAYASFQGGQNHALSSPVPADWLAANGNNFPNAPGCPEPDGGTIANDPIMLKLRVRVPTNANSFSLSSYFSSSEYPEWVCSPYNDFFVVLLDSAFSGMPANPADKNLARYIAPDSSVYPVGVNLAHGDTGLFRACANGPTGCGMGSVAGNTTTCQGTGELAGTGFDVANPPSQFLDEPGWCGSSNLAGGGTGWLTTSGNVVPGEVLELRFAVWDTGDPWYDSVVLLDNFTWNIDASDPGTVID